MKKILILAITILSVLNINAQTIDCVTGPAGTSPQQITIDFSPPATPCGPFVSYEIWGAEDENGTYSLIETITTESTHQSIHNLTASDGSIWYYYVVFNYNCPGNPPIISNIATNEFTNANIEIQNIDIHSNPFGIEITWQQSPYSQTVGYEVGILQPNGTVLTVGTTNSITDTSFTDIIPNPANDIDYVISIVDGCGNPSSFNPNPYSQVLLNEPEQDRCGQLISLNWEAWEYPYDNAPNLSYNILASVNGIDTVVAGNQTLSTTDFNFFNFNDGDTIYFRIEVVEDDGTVRSTSEWKEIFAQIVQPPTDFFIEYLTVNDQNLIDVYFYIDTLAEIRNFKINNSTTDITHPDNLVRKDNFDIATKGNPHKYKPDTITDPSTSYYYYQVVANDSCTQDHYSTKGKTIWLHGNLEDFFLNKIEWNEFELENANVSTYRLYRDYGDGMQFVQSFAPGETEYLDNVEEYYSQKGTFCYKIEADYTIPVPNEADAHYTTQSNTMCLEQRPSVYIPNAIAPNGVNNEFKPVIVFANPTDYTMRIFNRWGEVIFYTNNPNEAWQGTKNGKPVVTGGYPYNISFTAPDGTKIQKKGIVTVVY